MRNIEAAQIAKADKILNTLVAYSTGVMTRREWLRMMKDKNAIVEVASKPRFQFSRTKFNSFTNQRLQDEYYAKTEQRIPQYRISNQGESTFWEITKTEFDYYNSI